MEEKCNKKSILKNERKKTFLKGLVVPSLWDDSGNITGISLSTFNEDIFLIDYDEKGRELVDFIGKEVEIEGVLKTERLLNKITVNNFRYFEHD